MLGHEQSLRVLARWNERDNTKGTVEIIRPVASFG
jgi:hypothetical protein